MFRFCRWGHSVLVESERKRRHKQSKVIQLDRWILWHCTYCFVDKCLRSIEALKSQIVFHFQAWSRHITNMLISACGDSNILLWDVDSNANAVTSIFSGYSKPKSYYCEHSKEVCCVDWNHLSEDSLFLSSSWDCSIKLWNPDYAMSLKTYNSHTKLVYESRFAKKIPNIFMSVSADGYLKIWDVLQPQPVSSILAHQKSEVI